MTEDKLEIKGRLLLWHTALLECEQLFKMIKRAELEINTKEALEKEHRHTIALQNFASTQPDYRPGTMKNEHAVAFSKIQPKEFGAYTDCYYIKESLLMLAVVFFCQIFNSGYKSKGKAAANNKEFVSKHINHILIDIFPLPEELDRFELLKKQLVTARDRMIGHADGDAFNIVHGTPITSMKSYSAGLKEIDVEYWISVVEPLRLAVLKYAQKVISNQSAGAEAFMIGS